MADKHKVLICQRNGQLITIYEIELNLMDGLLRNGHQTLFRTFSLHLDELVIEKEVLMNEVANKIYDSQKIEYLTVDGVVAVHKALNFIIPLIQYEISHGEQWDSIKDKYIDKYLFLLTI